MPSAGPKILMLGPDDYYYRRILSNFADGFAEAGCQVFWHCGEVESAAVAQLVRSKDFQFVFEINDMVGHVDEWPKETHLISWFHDNYFIKEYLHVKNSASMSYFLFDPAVFGVDIPKSQKWAHLAPGAALDNPEAPRIRHRCDVSFCGFIPRPIANRQVASDVNGAPVHLNKFLNLYPASFYAQSTFDAPASRKKLAEICEQLNCRLLPNADRVFEDTLVRFHERASILWKISNVTNAIDIYGIKHWKEWEKFAPYYRGEIEDKDELLELYKSSKINIHNGTIGLHSRVFDCLAAGGFLLSLKTPRDKKLAGIATVFEPGVHYDDFTVDDADEVCLQYLHDEELRLKIATQGMDLVRSDHTWRHRALKVLDDLGIPSQNRKASDTPPREIDVTCSENSRARRTLKAEQEIQADSTKKIGDTVSLRRELEEPYSVFYVTSWGYAADHYFGWFPKALNSHPEIFALLAHEGSRPKYLKERTRSERPDLPAFTEFLNDMSMTYQAIGDCYSYRAPEIGALLRQQSYRAIPALNLIRNPINWLEFYIKWRAGNMRMRAGTSDPLRWEWKITAHEIYAELGLKSYEYGDVDIWAAYRGLTMLRNIKNDVQSRIMHIPIERLVEDRFLFNRTVGYLTQGRCRFSDEDADRAFSMIPTLFRGEEPVESDPDKILDSWPDWKFDAFRKLVDPETIRTFSRFGYDLSRLETAFKTVSAPQTQQRRGSATPIKMRPIFMSSVMKSGTWFLREILDQITGLSWIEPPVKELRGVSYENADLIRFEDGHYFSWHSIINDAAADKLKHAHSRNIFLLRNMSDVVISMCNHFKFDVDASSGGSIGNPSFLSNFENDELISMIIGGFVSGNINWSGLLPHMKQLVSFLTYSEREKDTLLVDYNDLTERPEEQVAKLANYLRISLDPARISEIAEATRFDSMRERAAANGTEAHFTSQEGRVTRADLKNHHISMIRGVAYAASPGLIVQLRRAGFPHIIDELH